MVARCLKLLKILDLIQVECEEAFLNYFYRRNYNIDVYLNPIGYPIPCIALYSIK